jgi:two-component system OmpR family sensor kinase
MRRPRTLRSRLFSWFVGAILLAITTSALVASRTRPESVLGLEAVARHIADRLGRDWDDAGATRDYASEVRDVTGFEVRLVRDPQRLGGRVRRVVDEGGVWVAQGPQRVVIPVVHDGALRGALEIDGLGSRAGSWGWWRLALALLSVVAVLSAMASGVANQLARPLERLARAADRVGAGDLAFRTELGGGGGQRWAAREVRDVAVSFNRMADRVEAMVRSQRELLGAISHELRSPLGRARVALEMARDRLVATEPGRSPESAIDEVETQLGAVDTILGDLLDMTRAGLADVHKERRPIVEWLLARIAEESTPPAIELVATPEARETVLAFDGALLGRVVHNLLVNARAHGHEPGEPLHVGVSRQGLGVVVTVSDRGNGFAPGFVERAFEPFVRGDASRARPSTGPGYGLGLAIVRRIVEAHGGRVFARNAPAQAADASGGARTGAEVGFELPLSPADR